jgi:hypothetical protein
MHTERWARPTPEAHTELGLQTQRQYAGTNLAKHAQASQCQLEGRRCSNEKGLCNTGRVRRCIMAPVRT